MKSIHRLLRYFVIFITLFFLGCYSGNVRSSKSLHLEPTFPDENHHSAFYSPDGKKIVYSARIKGSYEVVTVNADGSGTKILTGHPAYDGNPSWSADGNKIVFRSDRTGNMDIYIMNIDGSDLVNVTRHPADDGEVPSWSPDGNKILFHSNRNGNFDIYVMDSDGSNIINLTNHPERDSTPTWSPDGSKIAFYSRRDGNREIYVMNADGSNPLRLTNDPHYDGYPFWSPDGKKLVYISIRSDAGNEEIYSINSNGSGKQRLTNMPDWDLDPSWSPDGKTILFNSRRDGRRGVYTMNPDGSEVFKITNKKMSEFINVVYDRGVDEALKRHEYSKYTNPQEHYFLETELRNLAKKYFRENRINDSKKLFELNLQEFPNSCECSADLVPVYKKLGKEVPESSLELLKTFRDKGVEAGLRKFRENQNKFPVWCLISESQINNLGYEYLGQEDVSDAISIFKLNVELHPGSANTYDSLGEAYVYAGNTKLAILYYEKALALNPNMTSAINQLKKLKKD